MPRTLADKMRSDLGTVFFRTDHFAVDGVYHSKIEGSKPVKVIIEETDGGPVNQQHAKTLTRTATVWIQDDLTEGVTQIHELDTLTVTEHDQAVTWSIAKPNGIRSHGDGQWGLRMTTFQLISQGQNKPNGI